MDSHSHPHPQAPASPSMTTTTTTSATSLSKSFDPLSENFEPKRRLWKELKDVGRGCFGEIKLIEDPETGKRYVKKLIPGPITEEKTKNEIACMRRLRHKNIINLYDAYQEDIKDKLHTILILEFAEGGDLLEYIKRRHRLSENEGRAMFLEILSGLDFTHNELIVHRDIKAENVFLDKNFRPKIGDWGFAGPWHPDETQDIFCGSLHYSAPEICSGVNYVGPEVDVWSLGVLLYAMICGALPFSGETEWQIFEKIRVASFRLPPFISSSAADLLLRLLQVEPKKRISISEIKRHPWVQGSSLSPLLVSPLKPIQTLSAPTLIGETHKRNNLNSGGFNFGKKIKERFLHYKAKKPSGLTPIAEDNAPNDHVGSPPESPHPPSETVHFEIEEEEEFESPLSPQRALSRALDKENRRKFSLGRLFTRLQNATSNERAGPRGAMAVSHKLKSSPSNSDKLPITASAERRNRADSDGKNSALNKLKRFSTTFGNS
eukprot:TRINITY_DN6866_c0_g1_i1.p1 TRINITY_DN6866_c0_g1~~TRINITY_DN6866_c0_g1_i1.p1  ORF type:complete len:491 (+),score=119.85 TRINITY_DN6866_c0_g1_i1:93-1565(+)